MKTQQLECYAAELTLGSGRSFADYDAVQRWVDDLRDTPWWHLQGYSLHVLRIEVGPAARLAREFAGVGWFEREKSVGRVELKRDALDERTILHEVAHVIASAVHDSKAHDPAWARTYLTLVSSVMGADAYLTLQRSFDKLGVDYDAPTRAASSTFAL